MFPFLFRKEIIGMSKLNRVTTLVLIICLFCSSLLFIQPLSVHADGIEDNENAKKLYAHILGRGGTDWWASAAVGNSYAEHGCNSDIDGSGYWGAFQFSSDSKGTFQSWCSNNGRETTDITAQYDWFMAEYRGATCKGLTGMSPEECEKDTTNIKDAKSAAAYFALGMEGCVCYSGITNGVGSIYDSFHDTSSRCTTYTFPTKYGEVCLQDLQKRTPNTTVAYNAFSGKVAPTTTENGNVDENGNADTPTTIQSVTGGAYYTEEQLSAFVKLAEDNIQKEYLDNATRDNLSQHDLENLSSWEDNVKNSKKEYGLIAWMRIIVMWVGIIFTIYIFLLYLAYWFDKLNSIVDLDILSIMTFGRLHVAMDDKEANFSLAKKQDRMTVNHKDMVFICLTGLIFGTLLITGTFYKIVANFVNTILRWIG